MSGRGGHRVGSGRKPDFDILECLAIGGEFERRLAVERERLNWERHEARKGMVALREAQTLYLAEAREVGGEFISSHRRRDMADHVAESVRTMRLTPGCVDEPNRLFDKPEVRAKGLVDPVARDVAGHFTVVLGKPVSTRMAKRCLAKHRSLFRKPKAHL